MQFQFGIKMGEGRKTRKNQGKNHEKKIDRELAKINQHLKRKENISAPHVPTATELKKRRKPTDGL